MIKLPKHFIHVSKFSLIFVALVTHWPKKIKNKNEEHYINDEHLSSLNFESFFNISLQNNNHYDYDCAKVFEQINISFNLLQYPYLFIYIYRNVSLSAPQLTFHPPINLFSFIQVTRRKKLMMMMNTWLKAGNLSIHSVEISISCFGNYY